MPPVHVSAEHEITEDGTPLFAASVSGWVTFDADGYGSVSGLVVWPIRGRPQELTPGQEQACEEALIERAAALLAGRAA